MSVPDAVPTTVQDAGQDAGQDAVARAVRGVLLPGFTGTTPPAWLVDAAHEGLAGVVLFAHNTPDVATTADLTGRLHELAPTLLVATDEEGGDVSRLEAATGSSLPGAAALGLLDDVPATEAAGEALGRMLAAAGVDLDLAPVLDVNRPENPVIGVRAFGDDAEHVARHGAAFTRGLRRGGVGTCGKHFPGHGATTADSHLELPVVPDDLATLRRRDLVPFAAALSGDGSPDGRGLDALMTAHVRVPALGPAPASLEPAVTALARDLFREHGTGDDGLIITDALDMRAVSDGADVGEAAVRAVEAGADLLCLGTTVGRDDEALFRTAVDALTAAVRTGRVTVEALQASAARAAALAARARDLRSRAGVTPGAEAAVAAQRTLAELGTRLAARAVAGGLAPCAGLAGDPGPDVVDLRVRLDHAAGRTAQHVQRAVRERWPDAVTHPPLDDAALAALLGAPPTARRPLVLITREPAPGSPERARLEAAWAARPDLVVVHVGLPATSGRVVDWFTGLPGGPPPVVSACGTGRTGAHAAVDLLAAGWPGPGGAGSPTS
ncbi:glycoside hydrolase family 3 protein [Isoptericola sp. BMS4]|uniref:glycoside hydrolase family 3 protein n=1 Tax=Isoptericola sp. BMS4 TaxID=2527875 RepID=UPI00141F5B80|nr:glycoside hydrolase family 3 protein [Isoptericola sp. BMS4]